MLIKEYLIREFLILESQKFQSLKYKIEKFKAAYITVTVSDKNNQPNNIVFSIKNFIDKENLNCTIYSIEQDIANITNLNKNDRVKLNIRRLANNKLYIDKDGDIIEPKVLVRNVKLLDSSKAVIKSGEINNKKLKNQKDADITAGDIIQGIKSGDIKHSVQDRGGMLGKTLSKIMGMQYDDSDEDTTMSSDSSGKSYKKIKVKFLGNEDVITIPNPNKPSDKIDFKIDKDKEYDALLYYNNYLDSSKKDNIWLYLIKDKPTRLLYTSNEGSNKDTLYANVPNKSKKYLLQKIN
jgi:hypothetical protein